MEQTTSTVKVERLERRREKLLAESGRTRLKLDKADRAMKRLVQTSIEQDRQLRRLERSIAKAKTEVVVEPPPVAEGTASREIATASNELVRASKPKRQRKPKPLAETLDVAAVAAKIERDARMKAAGFRKVTR